VADGLTGHFLDLALQLVEDARTFVGSHVLLSPGARGYGGHRPPERRTTPSTVVENGPTC
jgi:hypothetical protein